MFANQNTIYFNNPRTDAIHGVSASNRESRLIYFADPVPPGGSGGGKPPEPEKKNEENLPEGYVKAKEELNKDLADKIITSDQYRKMLREKAEEFSVVEKGDAGEIHESPTDETIKAEQDKTKGDIDNVLEGENVGAVREPPKEEVAKKIQYPEQNLEKVDEIKGELEKLGKDDAVLFDKINKIAETLKMEKKDHPERYLYSNTDKKIAKNFSEYSFRIQGKYVSVDGVSKGALDKELKRINDNIKISPSHISEKDLKRKIEIEDVLMPDLKEKETLFNKLIEDKKKQAEIEEKFREKIKELTKISRGIDRRITDQAIKSNLLDNACKVTGINIREGAILKFKDLEEDETGKLISADKTVRIKKISFEKKKDEETGKEFEISGPKIIIEDLEGTKVGGPYTVGRFKKFVDQNDAVEVIDSIEDLNRNLGLGVDIKKGMEIEYNVYSSLGEKGAHLKKIPQTVKIEDIKDGKIILDKELEIYLDKRIEGGGPRKYKEMTFGEFSKWYINQEANEKMASIEDLQTKLKALNDSNNQKLKRDESMYPPITLGGGEALRHFNSSDPEYFIEKITPEAIQVKTHNGNMDMTPTQFYKWVEDNGLEKYDPTLEAKKKLEFMGKDDVEKYNRELAITEAKEAQKLAHAKHEAEHNEHSDGHNGKKENALFGWNDKNAMWSKYSLWYDMRFLCYDDFKQMGKTIWEFAVRKHQRKTKYNYSLIGKGLPGQLGVEFERIKQSAENEEVEQYKGAMKDWGIWAVKRTMWDSGNTDEVKACLLVLAEKGELRWDDPKLYETLTRITHGRHQVKKETPDCEKAINFLWGEGQYDDLYMHNNSHYESLKSNYKDEGKHLENDPNQNGGLKGKLKTLLHEWKEGEYVSPMEYEQLICFAIDAGKLSAEDKIFFIMSGILATSPQGFGALLPFNRIGAIEGQYLSKFPMLDYLIGLSIRDWHKPPREEKKLTLEDFKYLKDTYFKNDYDNNAVGPAFKSFFWEDVMTNKNTLVRVNKGLRNAEDIDHEDAPIVLPLASPEQLRNMLGAGVGSKKYFSPEAYANAYAGFSQYLISLTKKINKTPKTQENKEELKEYENLLKECLKSFVTYDTIINSRLEKDAGDRYQRLGSYHFDQGSVIDRSMKTRTHEQQLQGVIIRAAKAYGESDENLKFLFEEKAYSNKKEQDDLELKIDNFIKEKIPEWFERDGGKIVLEEIARGTRNAQTAPDGLKGFGYGGVIGGSGDNEGHGGH